MISLHQCEKILNTKKRKYTKAQIEKIRDFLYQVAILVSQSEQLKNEESGGKKSHTI
jgi:hypothetical protein